MSELSPWATIKGKTFGLDNLGYRVECYQNIGLMKNAAARGCYICYRVKLALEAEELIPHDYDHLDFEVGVVGMELFVSITLSKNNREIGGDTRTTGPKPPRFRVGFKSFPADTGY